jgi:uncharacterized protein YbjQ (UPF0145 family)/RNA polymerase subunit RPABC4/transcription elongation factor Spt4
MKLSENRYCLNCKSASMRKKKCSLCGSRDLYSEIEYLKIVDAKLVADEFAKQAIDRVKLFTVDVLQNYNVVKEFGLVYASHAKLSLRLGDQAKHLKMANEMALSKIKMEADLLGGNAVIGIKIISENRARPLFFPWDASSDAIMLIGTAVSIEEKEESYDL